MLFMALVISEPQLTYYAVNIVSCAYIHIATLGR